jgi:uncharacterized protein (TIGR03083 family)
MVTGLLKDGNMTEAYETYIGWLAAENEAFADACERDVNAPVPTCPGWSVLDLLAHHASYQTWTAQIVTERLVEPRSPLAVTPPDGDPIGWYRAIGTKLIKAFQSANAHAQVWSVTNQATVSAWARRQASETSVHRWDAQNATGVTEPLRHAHDYLSEMLTTSFPDSLPTLRRPSS